jgi:hypothetical protein
MGWLRAGRATEPARRHPKLSSVEVPGSLFAARQLLVDIAASLLVDIAASIVDGAHDLQRPGPLRLTGLGFLSSASKAPRDLRGQ